MEFIFELIADLFLGDEETKPSLPVAVAETVVPNETVQLAMSADEMDMQNGQDNLFGIMEFH